MGKSNYSFPNGVIANGVPLQMSTPGEVFWVNNSSVLVEQGIGGSNNNKGSYKQPFSTIDYAVSKCKANRGDIIMVMPGHVETVATAAAVDLDVAGISVIGLGTGTLQPRLDFTATAGTVEVNADNVTIKNMNFHANVSAVVIGLSVLTLATDLVVSDCTFDVETTATDEFLIGINFGVGCDNFLVENTKMDMGLGGAATGIKLVGATAGGTIKGCRIVGDYSQANIAGITTLSTEIYIEDNLLVNGGGGALGTLEVIEMLTGTTGVVRDNTIFSDVATHVLMTVADTMLFSNNNRSDDTGAASTAALTSASVVASADA